MNGMRVSPINPELVEVGTPRGWEPLAFHLFTRSPHSPAGNCVCGGSFEHVRHPHEPVPIGSDPTLCVCSQPIRKHIAAAGRERDIRHDRTEGETT